jgi:hypothetical protein
MGVFRTIGMDAKLGELFCDSTDSKNKWKKRMIAAGLPDLDFPDDWDTLTEDEKEKRLNQIIDLTLFIGKEVA